MSYILDALKKSEQERGHGNVPGVQTVHTSSLNYKDKKAFWPYILITVVALNLIVMLYFILAKDSSENEKSIDQVMENTATQVVSTPTEAIDERQLSQSKPAPAPSQTSREQYRSPVSEAVETITENNTDSAPLQEQPEPVVQTDYSPTPTSQNDIISYHELDESIKQQLPAIIVSAHVYSSNPQQRSIVINNNFLEEGEYIIDGLILHEITPNGAILNYNGILFRSDVVSGWQ